MEKGIKASWSLIAFARTHGKLSIAPLVNKETGEAFKKLCFTHPTNKDEEENPLRTYVGFSSKLGELTGAEIVRMKDDLQVVQLESGTYKLCKSGSTWEEVDLGL
jgi:hypothetical protein